MALATRRGRRNSANGGVQLAAFAPAPIGRARAITTVFTLAVISGPLVGACQHGHVTHTTEMICVNRNNCSFEFRQEILFNEINRKMCVSILHGNQTVGAIYLEKEGIEMQCSRNSLFFTRDTRYEMYSEKRCYLMGTCSANACANVRINSIVPEIAHAAQFPGYSGCTHTCGGLPCGCLLPFPSCTFYRIAHKPQSHAVYEVIKCLEWKPQVRMRIRLSFYNNNVEKKLKLFPYVEQKIDDISITVISITQPTYSILNNKFAMSDNETLSLPDNYNLPVECPTSSMAFYHFEQCKNKFLCSCELTTAPSSCKCPLESIQHLRSDISNVLPITTSSLILVNERRSINAITTAGEVVISVNSKAMRNSAQYVLQQDCQISVSGLTGCYDCQEGAELTTQCRTDFPTWTVIQCENIVFSMPCDPTAKRIKTVLEFSSAVVNQECHTECNGKLIKFRINGTLAFLPHFNDSEILQYEGSQSTSTFNWFSDFKLPDVLPLVAVMQKHWKLSIGILGTAVLLTIVTYAIGPTVVFLILQLTLQCLASFLRTIGTVAILIFEIVHRLFRTFANLVRRFA